MKMDILSFPVYGISTGECVLDVRLWIKQKKRKYICVASLHLLTDGLERASVGEAIRKADLVVPDGMPLVYALRWRGNRNVERVYGPDLMLSLCRAAVSNNWRVGLLGGSAGQSLRLKIALKKRFPGISIVVVIDTPRRPIEKKENEKIIQKINTLKPNILFVGLGCPLQELWMAENVDKFNLVVLVGVGAAFNFITGDVKQAPQWVRTSGSEWLYRITQEPVRLIPRYLRIFLAFVKYALGFYRK